MIEFKDHKETEFVMKYLNGRFKEVVAEVPARQKSLRVRVDHTISFENNPEVTISFKRIKVHECVPCELPLYVSDKRVSRYFMYEKIYALKYYTDGEGCVFLRAVTDRLKPKCVKDLIPLYIDGAVFRTKFAKQTNFYRKEHETYYKFGDQSI